MQNEVYLMELIIERAFMQTLQDTLGVLPMRIENKLLKGYLSKIDFAFNDGLIKTITFVSSKEFLEILGKSLLGDCKFNDMEFCDLSQELANLTMGLAKVLAVKENVHFNIATPQIFGFGEFQDAQYHCLSFALDGAFCSLFIHP